MKRTPEIVTAVTGLLFLGAVVRQFGQSLTYGHDHWGMSEWLIDYAGGFVRRGLVGEIMRLLSAATGITANLLVIGFSFVLLFMLFAVFVVKGGRRLPLAFVLSPILLGAPVYQELIVRKDVLGILLLLTCLWVYQKQWPIALRVVLVNVLAVIGVLSHEAFFFFSAPALILYFASDAHIRPAQNGRARTLARLSGAVLMLAPVLAAFVLTVIYRGNGVIAHAVNDSWIEMWKHADPNGCCLDAPLAAIEALQWSPEKALSYSASVLHQFSYGIYVPLAWIVTILIGAWFAVGVVEGDDKEKKRLASILIIQLVAIVPLFVVGWDFGRWIFLWAASAISFFIMNVNLSADVAMLTKIPANILTAVAARWRPRPIYLLFFGIPPCCWSLSAYVSFAPLGYYYRLIAPMLHLP